MEPEAKKQKQDNSPVLSKAESLTMHWIDAPLKICLLVAKFLPFELLAKWKAYNRVCATTNLIKIDKDRFFSSGTAQDSLTIWDYSTETAIWNRECELVIDAKHLSKDRLATSHYVNGNGIIRIWDLNSGNCIHTMSHSGCVWKMCRISDNMLAAQGTAEDSISIWDVDKNVCAHKIKDQYNKIFVDQNRLIVCHLSHKINVWNLDTLTCTDEFNLGYDRGYINLLSTGEILIIDFSGMRRLNLQTKNCIITKEPRLDCARPLTKFIEMPDHQIACSIFAGNDRYFIEIWNWDVPKLLQSLTCEEHATSLLYMDDKLIAGHNDGLISVWGQ